MSNNNLGMFDGVSSKEVGSIFMDSTNITMCLGQNNVSMDLHGIAVPSQWRYDCIWTTSMHRYITAILALLYTTTPYWY